MEFSPDSSIRSRRQVVSFLESDDEGIVPRRFVPEDAVRLKDTGFDIRIEVSVSRIHTDSGDLALASFHEIRHTREWRHISLSVLRWARHRL